MKIVTLALMFVASVAIAAEQTAFGIAGDPSKVTRTIAIDMSDDMRYAPAALDVKLGETVRFVVANKGATMHELVLGTKGDIDKHAQAMKRAQSGNAHAHHTQHVHAAPSMVHVLPARAARWSGDSTAPERSSTRASSPATTRPG